VFNIEILYLSETFVKYFIIIENIINSNNNNILSQKITLISLYGTRIACKFKITRLLNNELKIFSRGDLYDAT